MKGDLNELALFAGAGGGILGGLLTGFRTVGAVEIDPYCREILLRRQEEGFLPPFPVWDDIRTFDGRPWRGAVDIVTAGFPCQPFSSAGKRLGTDDNRNLWPDTARVLREVVPRVALLENVPHLLAHDYFGEILGDLAEAGFDAEWGTLSAAGSGAVHFRRRCWILAYTDNNLTWIQPRRMERKNGSHTVRIGSTFNERPLAKPSKGFVEPRVCRTGDGIPHRVDRLGALGNAQVPAVAMKAFRSLIERIDP